MSNESSVRIPRATKHSSGQAVVRLNGHDHYLGKHGTRAAKNEYDRLTSEWLAGGRQLPDKHGGLSINELILAYLGHATNHYRKPNGEPTRQLELVRLA